MLPVQTKCSCGRRAQLTRTAEGLYYVTCSCGQSGRYKWHTMTVAIIDWDQDRKDEAESRPSQLPA